MFQLKLIDLNPSTFPYIYALSFNDGTDQAAKNVAHVKEDNDFGETCAEYNRRAVTDLGTAQGWCAACIDMFLGYTVVEGCRSCKKQYIQRNVGTTVDEDGHEVYTQIFPVGGSRPTNLEWWTLGDSDIQQLLSVPQPPDVKERKPWKIFPKGIDGNVLARLGLTCGCSMCLQIALAVVGRLRGIANIGAKVAIKSVMPNLVHRPNYIFEPLDNRVVIPLSWEWYLDGEKQPRHEYAGDLEIPLRSTQKQLDVVCDRFRFDPLFLKGVLDKSLEECSQSLAVSSDTHHSHFPDSFRLIDVQKQCVVHIGNVHVKYSAISYRWDSNDANMLTKENESEFMTPGFLSTKTMSRTLYDCMQLAKDLGIPYIWIDRYCIIQGDNLEKAEQIHAMGDIYENSWLTVICAMDKDINSGLYGYSRNFGRSFFSSDFESIKGTIDRWDYEQSEYGPEWATRGWTLQEEHLSPRRLYMTDFTLVWHINCPTVTYHHVALGQIPKPHDVCCSGITSSLTRILRSYIGRSLTYPIDRLNAISGFLKAKGVEHIYGISTRRIRESLMWRTPRRGTEGTRCDVFPTWSWAHKFTTATWVGVYSSFKVYKSAPILHHLTPMAKRASLIRRMGLDINFVNELSDKHLVVLARGPRRSRKDLIVQSTVDMSAQIPKVIRVNLFLGLYNSGTKADTFYLLVKPMAAPTESTSPNVIHARRVDVVNPFGPIRGLPTEFYSVAWIRPMAIQSMTLLKTFRLRLQSKKRGYKSFRLRKPNVHRKHKKPTEKTLERTIAGAAPTQPTSPNVTHAKRVDVDNPRDDIRGDPTKFYSVAWIRSVAIKTMTWLKTFRLRLHPKKRGYQRFRVQDSSIHREHKKPTESTPESTSARATLRSDSPKRPRVKPVAKQKPVNGLYYGRASRASNPLYQTYVIH